MTIRIDPTNVVVIVLGLATIVLTAIPLWKKAGSTTARRLIVGVIAGALIIAVAPFIHFDLDNSGQTSTQPSLAGSPAGSGEPSPVLPGVSLAFRRLSNESVPECKVYEGDGHIPDGHALVIFDRPIDERSNEPTGTYYMTPEAATNNDNGSGWHTGLIDVGAPRVEIAAVLIPGALFEALRSIELVNVEKSSEAAWKIKDLPPGQRLEPLRVRPRLKTATDPSGCVK